MARDQRNVIRRIQGLMALGYLKHKEAWEIALEAANAKQPYLSIVGCQTLIRLNPEEGITILLKKYAAMDAFPSSQAPSTVTSF